MVRIFIILKSNHEVRNKQKHVTNLKNVLNKLPPSKWFLLLLFLIEVQLTYKMVLFLVTIFLPGSFIPEQIKSMDTAISPNLHLRFR